MTSNNMSKYFSIRIKVHNFGFDCNGIKSYIKDGIISLRDCNAYGNDVVETCRVISQWLYGTNFANLIATDYHECKSCGKLGTNLSKLFELPFVEESVYRSSDYKDGKKKSYFEIFATYNEL